MATTNEELYEQLENEADPELLGEIWDALHVSGTKPMTARGLRKGILEHLDAQTSTAIAAYQPKAHRTSTTTRATRVAESIEDTHRRGHEERNEVRTPTSLLDRGMLAKIRTQLGEHNVTGVWQTIGLVIAGIVWQAFEGWLEDRKFLDEKEGNDIRAATTVEINEKLLAVIEVLESPDLADNARLKKILGTELAKATAKAGKRMKNTEGGTGKSFLEELADMIEGKGGAK